MKGALNPQPRSHIPERERLWRIRDCALSSLKHDSFKSAGTTKSPKEKELERSRNTTSGTSTWHWTIYHLVGIVDDCNQEREIVNCQVHIFSCPMRHSTRNGHHLLGIHEHLSPFVYLSMKKKWGVNSPIFLQVTVTYNKSITYHHVPLSSSSNQWEFVPVMLSPTKDLLGRLKRCGSCGTIHRARPQLFLPAAPDRNPEFFRRS